MLSWGAVFWLFSFLSSSIDFQPILINISISLAAAWRLFLSSFIFRWLFSHFHYFGWCFLLIFSFLLSHFDGISLIILSFSFHYRNIYYWWFLSIDALRLFSRCISPIFIAFFFSFIFVSFFWLIFSMLLCFLFHASLFSPPRRAFD